jgi:hypothetical protein
MQSDEALVIIKALADGINPQTGEVFPYDSPYQHPQSVRALMLAVQAMQQVEERPRRERILPANAGKPWSLEDDRELCQRYDGGDSIEDLAAETGRTRGAIRSRLVKLGRLQLYTEDAVVVNSNLNEGGRTPG